MINLILSEIGLSTNETKVYIALLDNGESTTGEILDNANLQTGKIYEILNSLKNKGMVSIIIKNGVKHFSPADPQRVLDYIHEKQKNIEKQKTDFESILPQIMGKIHQMKESIHIEIFTGFKGIKNAYEKEMNVVNKNSTLYDIGILSPAHYDKKIDDYFKHNVRVKRQRAGIQIKKILNKSANREDHEQNAKIKYLPFGSPVTITTVENLTIIGIFTELPIAITIESNVVAKSFIEHFNMLWRLAKNKKLIKTEIN